MTTATGGAKGGGAKLTELGKSIIARYRAIELQAAKAAAPELTELTKTTAGSTVTDERTSKRRDRAPR
jgi:molybdate transport repressor ModE-like protein